MIELDGISYSRTKGEKDFKRSDRKLKFYIDHITSIEDMVDKHEDKDIKSHMIVKIAREGNDSVPWGYITNAHTVDELNQLIVDALLVRNNKAVAEFKERKDSVGK